MEDLKSLVDALKREIELLEELVKVKDDLIQQMKFSPTSSDRKYEHSIFNPRPPSWINKAK